MRLGNYIDQLKLTEKFQWKYKYVEHVCALMAFFVLPLMPFSIARLQLGPVYKSYRSFPYIAAPKLDHIMYSYKQMTHKHNFGYQITASLRSVNWPPGSDYMIFFLFSLFWTTIHFLLTLIIDEWDIKHSRYFRMNAKIWVYSQCNMIWFQIDLNFQCQYFT